MYHLKLYIVKIKRTHTERDNFVSFDRESFDLFRNKFSKQA